MPYTECELRHRLNDYLAQVLRGQTTMGLGVSAAQLQSALQSLGIEWLPLVTCQRAGQYVLTTELLSVEDRASTRRVCLDHSGEEEMNCESNYNRERERGGEGERKGGGEGEGGRERERGRGRDGE